MGCLFLWSLLLFVFRSTALKLLFRRSLGMTTTDDVVIESPFTSLIKVQHAGSKGRGLFAKAFIPKGTLIGNFPL